MSYTVFNKEVFDAKKEFMFFGKPVSTARFDEQKHKVFEDLTEKTLGFFWRPQEISVKKDAKDFRELPEHEKRIFLLNLKYQTILDSVQGRSPNICFLPIVSLPELENWIETWSFSESIHSRSYTHIIRSVLPNPTEVFDSILLDEEIVKRAEAVTKYYDNLHKFNCEREVGGSEYCEYAHKKAYYLCLHSVAVLEAIRFYVSFACSFSFAERDLMNGNADIIKLVCRDESIHWKGTQFILNSYRLGKDDPEMVKVHEDCKEEVMNIWLDANAQEKDWARYLFKDGSMRGLNEEILCQYIDYLTDQRMRSVGLDSPFSVSKNPLPWMKNWTNTSNVQTTPQAKELTSYITGGLDSNINDTDFEDTLL